MADKAKKVFDPNAFNKQADPATNPPATKPGFDPFAPSRAKDNAPPPPPPDTRGVGDALLEAGRAANNYARAYADDWTYGLLDRTPEARAVTQQAKDELGAGGRLAAGGMAALTNPITAAIKTGSILKSGAVGAGQGMLDAYGHGGSLGDVAWGGLTGFGVGSGLHGLGLGAAELARKIGPKIANTTVGKNITQLVDNINARAGIKTPGGVTADALADQQLKFRQLDGIKYNPDDTLAGARSVQSQLYGGQTPSWLETDTPGTSGTLRRYVGNMIAAKQTGQDAGANSLHSVVRDLNDIITQKAGSEDAKAAQQARDQVLQMFNNIRPLNASQGVAKTLLDNANDAHATYKNSTLLDNMNANLNERGDMPGRQAYSIVDDPNQQGFYDPSQTAALKNIGAAGSKTPAAWVEARWSCRQWARRQGLRRVTVSGH